MYSQSAHAQAGLCVLLAAKQDLHRVLALILPPTMVQAPLTSQCL